MASLITLGLSQILVGTAAPGGTMPGTLAKIGKTYKDTCKVAQAASDVTEHFEEGKASPEVRKKTKKIPVLTFSMMDPDAQALADYIGGTVTNGKWGFDGSETVVNRAIRVQTTQGFYVDIPNADIEAVINSDLSAKGIFLVEFTVTPMAVSAGKAINMYDGTSGLTVSPTSLSFTSAADSTGQTITATSTGNLTLASKPDDVEWLTVTRSGKVATVKVVANANSETRSAVVTLIADGLTAYVTVTQAGA
jgi:hypothetical protein